MPTSAVDVEDSMQVAWFRHGVDRHSLVSTEQVSPDHPAAHAHEKDPAAIEACLVESVHTPSC